MVFPLGLEGFAGHIMSLYASVSLGFLSLSFREKQYCFQYVKHAWRRMVFLVSLGLSLMCSPIRSYHYNNNIYFDLHLYLTTIT